MSIDIQIEFTVLKANTLLKVKFNEVFSVPNSEL